MNEPSGIHPAHESYPERERHEDDLTETVAKGKSNATPFVLLGGVAVVVWTFVALLTAVCLLIWWLV